jgi:hypothetical protein
MAKHHRNPGPMGAEEAYIRGSRFFQEDRYALVFILIIITILSSVLFNDGTWGLLITLCLQTLTLFVALRTSDAGARFRRIGEVTALLVVVGVAAVILSGNPGPARIAYGFSMIVLVGVTPIVIVRRLITHPVININTVTGAADIYLLFGLFFSVIYALIGDVVAHGATTPALAFFIASRPVNANDFIYYSFVTLTTVGYGDVVASTEIGRMLSITEALLGQLYLVTVVALLVANIGRPGRRPIRDAELAEKAATDSAEQPG